MYQLSPNIPSIPANNARLAKQSPIISCIDDSSLFYFTLVSHQGNCDYESRRPQPQPQALILLIFCIHDHERPQSMDTSFYSKLYVRALFTGAHNILKSTQFALTLCFYFFSVTVRKKLNRNYLSNSYRLPTSMYNQRYAIYD